MGQSDRIKRQKSTAGSAAKTGIDLRKRRLFSYLGTFLGILIGGAIIYPFISIWLDAELHGFMDLTAVICGKALSLFSSDISISEQFVTFDGFSIEIIEECTGLMEMLIFLAALLSYPASWKAKGIGFLLGIPTLYLFNIIRIIFLTIVGAHANSLFKFMHLYFWQATLILMITGVWVSWILLVVNRDKKSRGLFT